MKKIFTLCAMLMLGMATTWADDVKVSWTMGENTTGAADPATAASDITYTVGSGLTENGTVSYSDIVFSNFDQNTGDTKGNNGKHDENFNLGKYVDFTFTPLGGDFTPTKVTFDIIKIGTGDPTIDVDVIDASGKVITVASNVAVRRNNNDTSPDITQTYEVSGAVAGTGAVTLRIIVGKLATKKAVGIANVSIEGTLVSADAPVLSATKEVALKVTPLTPEMTSTAVISLTGKNLANGTYDAPVPADEQFTITPATFTVAEGVVNQDFTLTFKPTMDVDGGVTKIFFTVGDIDASTTISYDARLEAYKQKEVNDSTTWDWEKLTETVELTDETVPSRKDDFVFLELEDQINFGDFDAQSIVISKTQFPVRNKKFQNGTIKIKTTADGIVRVDFSDTGSSGDGVKRYIKVNDEVTEYYTQRNGSSDRKVTDNIPVAAGEISICGWDPTAEVKDGEGNVIGTGANVAIVVYKLTFVPAENDANGIVSVKAEAQQGAIYNLAGQRVQNVQKGLYIQNGKKYVK